MNISLHPKCSQITSSVFILSRIHFQLSMISQGCHLRSLELRQESVPDGNWLDVTSRNHSSHLDCDGTQLCFVDSYFCWLETWMSWRWFGLERCLHRWCLDLPLDISLIRTGALMYTVIIELRYVALHTHFLMVKTVLPNVQKRLPQPTSFLFRSVLMCFFVTLLWLSPRKHHRAILATAFLIFKVQIFFI